MNSKRKLQYFSISNVTLFLAIFMFVPYLLIEEQYFRLFVRASKNLNNVAVVIVLVSLIFFVIGTLLGGIPRGRQITDSLPVNGDLIAVKFLYKTSYWLFCLGSFIWLIVPFFYDYSILEKLINLDLLPLAKKLRDSTSLRTLVNFGPVAYICSFYIQYNGTNGYVKKYRRGRLLIVLFTLARVVLTAERSPLILLIVIFTVILLRKRRVRINKLIFATTSLGLVIWTTEIFRSYTSDKYSGYTISSYLYNRLLVYYASSFHNLKWIWVNEIQEYGFISLRSIYKLVGARGGDDTVSEALRTYGSPEFNNLSSFGEIYIDLGYAYVLYWLLLGILWVSSLKSFLKNRFSGYLLFPFMVYTILEAPRFTTIFSTKFYYILLGLIVFNWLRRHRNERENSYLR